MRRRADAGFTIMELVVVIAIAGILAAFAASRINTQSFDTEGFANQTTAMIRYAQKVAIAQKRTVAVVFTGNNIKLCYTDAACSGGSVREPPSADLFQRNAPTNVALNGTSFMFDALGRPFPLPLVPNASSSGQTVTVVGDVTRNIVIEAQTGYVR